MSLFPDGFAEQTQPLSDLLMSTHSQPAVGLLASKGFEVLLGLTPEYAEEIIDMALEPAIREYCPNDCGKRFVDQDSVQKWLSKKRATFLLVKKNDAELRLAGYGWAGSETSERVPGGQTTFALRVGELGQGQGLATSFAQLIIDGAKELFGANKFWLETWASNGGAVHIYHKLGFEDVAKVESERPTLDGGTFKDVRIFMKLAD